MTINVFEGLKAHNTLHVWSWNDYPFKFENMINTVFSSPYQKVNTNYKIRQESPVGNGLYLC